MARVTSDVARLSGAFAQRQEPVFYNCTGMVGYRSLLLHSPKAGGARAVAEQFSRRVM